jgi:outer membrane immunogenic protein
MDGADQRFSKKFKTRSLEKKMKKFLLATVALVAIGATAPALAADLGARTYTKAPAYAPAPVYNWTGFYIGGHLGGAFNGSSGFSGAGVINSGDDARFLGGVQIGADYQFAPSWVVGIEAQYSWLGSNNRTTTFPTVPVAAFTYNERGLGSVTGRLGYTWGPALLYVKGGYAYSDNSQSLTIGGAAVAITGTRHDGYTVGAGLEYMFAPSWSAKVEYQYYDFGTTTFAAAPLAAFGSARYDDHTVKAGLNYRFNWGGPVVAKY